MLELVQTRYPSLPLTINWHRKLYARAQPDGSCKDLVDVPWGRKSWSLGPWVLFQIIGLLSPRTRSKLRLGGLFDVDNVPVRVAEFGLGGGEPLWWGCTATFEIQVHKGYVGGRFQLPGWIFVRMQYRQDIEPAIWLGQEMTQDWCRSGLLGNSVAAMSFPWPLVTYMPRSTVRICMGLENQPRLFVSLFPRFPFLSSTMHTATNVVYKIPQTHR